MNAAASAVRVVQWGCGRWGRAVLRTLVRHPRVYVACVVDPDPEARRQARQIAPDADVVDHADRLDSFDAGLVVTPAPTHASIALSALDAGLHVFVEKPLATSVTAARAMVEAAARSNKVAMVGHLLCYHPAVQQAIELTRSGAIGFLRSIDSERFSLASSREVDGSLLWSLAPHDLSVLRCLDPTEVMQVQATQQWVPVAGEPVASGLGAARPANVAAARFTLRSGVVATLSLSRAHASKTRRIILRGSQGKIVIDDLKPDHRKIFLETDEGNSFVSYEEDALPLDCEIHAWIQAITRGEPLPHNTFVDGLGIVKLIERAQSVLESSSTMHWRPVIV